MAKRVPVGTSLFPEHKLLLARLAEDLRRDGNQIIEEALEVYAKKQDKKSDAYSKFEQNK